MKITVIIPVKPVTKKNSQQIITNPKTGRPFIIPSKQFRDFEKECKPYMLQIKNEIGQNNITCELRFNPTTQKISDK